MTTYVLDASVAVAAVRPGDLPIQQHGRGLSPYSLDSTRSLSPPSSMSKSRLPLSEAELPSRPFRSTWIATSQPESSSR